MISNYQHIIININLKELRQMKYCDLNDPLRLNIIYFDKDYIMCNTLERLNLFRMMFKTLIYSSSQIHVLESNENYFLLYSGAIKGTLLFKHYFPFVNAF